MQQITAISTSVPTQPTGMGGFLDPLSVMEQFGILEGMKVADFGSGGGYFAICIAQRVGQSGRVYALDILEEKLDNLRAKARAGGLDNIETIRANLEVLGSSSLADGSQDMVLLTNILFQSNKKEAIIKEGLRVLRKDGIMIIIDWKKGAGGFGPPDDLRLDSQEIKSIAQKSNLSLTKEIDAGQFHFGFVFTKK